MKTKYSKVVILLSLILSVCLSSCNVTGPLSNGTSQNNQPPNAAALKEWEYTASITEPIKAIAGLETVVMTTPQEDFSVSIPILAFDNSTELTLTNPETVPEIDPSKFEPIGAPLDIAGAKTRLNRPAMLTFRVDPQSYAEDLRDQSIWITYYDGQTWEYFPPDSVNRETGEITFETYHFSLFGTGKISEEERLAQYAHKQAVLEFAEKNRSQLIEKMAATASEEIAKQLGMDPNSVTYIVVEGMSDTSDYLNMADQLHKGDYKEFSKTLSKVVTEKMAKAGIKTITHLGPQAALIHLIEVETKLIDHGINSWREEEVEAAYQLYKSGKGGRGFFGYFTSTGDFDDIWEQMRGVSRQLEADALEKEIARRLYLGLPQPTADELEAVRNQARADLKKQFDDRMNNEEVIAKQENRIKSMILAFQKAKLLDKYSFDYDPDTYTLEARLEQLFVLSDKILRDTGRNYFLSGDLSTEKEVSYGDLVALMQAWYISPEEYEKELEKRFGMKVTAAEPTSTPPTFDATPKSSKDCVYARDYDLVLEEVPALAPDYSSSEFTYSWDPGWYYICVRFEGGMVKSSPPDGFGGVCESDNLGIGLGITQAKISNGTYDQSGKIYFEFYLEDGSGRIISGNFSGEFYNPMDGSESYTNTPIFCQVKGTATGVVEDDMWNPNNGEILELQTSFSTNVITSFGE